MTTATARTGYRLLVGDLQRMPISVVRAPHLSTLRWLVEAARPVATSPMAAEIGRAVQPCGTLFLKAVGLPGLDRMPDAFLPVGENAPQSIPDYCSWLKDVDGDALAAEIDAMWGSRVPRPWRIARDHPRMWLEDASRATMAAWTVLSRRWSSLDALIRREEARVGTSAVTGNISVLLDTLTPRLRATDRYIEFDGACATTRSLSQGRFAFIPTLVPRHNVSVTFEPPAPYVAYPLPGTSRYAGPYDDDPTDRLALLLGTLRAAALRALDRPRTMSALAVHLHCAPSTLTYHCNQLAQVGLIERERRGHSIHVSLTARGVRFLSSIE